MRSAILKNKTLSWIGIILITVIFLIFKEEKIYIQEQFQKISGNDRLFWIMTKKIPNGKYKIRNDSKILKLYK